MSPFGIGGGGGSLVAPPPVDFNVDWGTATGTSVAALGDGGKLVDGGNNGSFCSVVPRATEVAAQSLADMPSDWPTNLFRLDPTSGWEFWQATNQWPAPAQGEYLFIRLLVYFGLPPGADLGQGSKIMQTNGGAIVHVFPDMGGQVAGDGTGLQMWFASLATVDPAPAFGRWQNNDIITYKPYRIEVRLYNEPGSNLTLRPAVLVFREDLSKTVPHLTGANFLDNFGTGSDDLLSDNPLITGTDVTEVFRQLIFGNSDQSGTTGNGGHIYKAGLAVRRSASADGWIGSYPTTGE